MIRFHLKLWQLKDREEEQGTHTDKKLGRKVKPHLATSYRLSVPF